MAPRSPELRSWWRAEARLRRRPVRRDRVETRYRLAVDSRAQALLEGSYIERSTRLGACFYVERRLDLRPVSVAIADRLIEGWGGRPPASVRFTGPRQLRESRLGTDLRDRLTSTDPSARGHRTVRLALRRRSGLWLLEADRVIDRIGAVDEVRRGA